MSITQWVDKFIDSLPPEAEFGINDRRVLIFRMGFCQMAELPEPVGEATVASGEVLCEECGQEYFYHPYDWRLLEYGGRPYLNILCNGQRVKL